MENIDEKIKKQNEQNNENKNETQQNLGRAALDETRVSESIKMSSDGGDGGNKPSGGGGDDGGNKPSGGGGDDGGNRPPSGGGDDGGNHPPTPPNKGEKKNALSLGGGERYLSASLIESIGKRELEIQSSLEETYAMKEVLSDEDERNIGSIQESCGVSREAALLLSPEQVERVREKRKEAPEFMRDAAWGELVRIHKYLDRRFGGQYEEVKTPMVRGQESCLMDILETVDEIKKGEDGEYADFGIDIKKYRKDYERNLEDLGFRNADESGWGRVAEFYSGQSEDNEGGEPQYLNFETTGGGLIKPEELEEMAPDEQQEVMIENDQEEYVFDDEYGGLPNWAIAAFDGVSWGRSLRQTDKLLSRLYNEGDDIYLDREEEGEMSEIEKEIFGEDEPSNGGGKMLVGSERLVNVAMNNFSATEKKGGAAKTFREKLDCIHAKKEIIDKLMYGTKDTLAEVSGRALAVIEETPDEFFWESEEGKAVDALLKRVAFRIKRLRHLSREQAKEQYGKKMYRKADFYTDAIKIAEEMTEEEDAKENEGYHNATDRHVARMLALKISDICAGYKERNKDKKLIGQNE